MSEKPQVEVVDAPARERFEASVDGERAGVLVYRARKGLLALIHTEVDREFEGQGVGGALARFALDRAREQGLAVLPFCPFVAGWLQHHREYVDLVPPEYRGQFDL